ncbi:hypothetical protein ACIO3O_34755 [Streptomyces sp. NPDC087440]|uniref:hypothetical protein n=1 Tax=Streptomyces sp. NPDC087440 TaxID=3365790 RepID=UPI0038208D49
MGKGKRLRKQGSKDRTTRGPRELAPEPSKASTRDDIGGGRLSSYARQELGKQVYAWMILLSYLECALDGPDGLPAGLLAPQKPDESDEDYTERIRTDRLVVETQAMASSPAEQVAEVLSSWVSRSMVHDVVGHLAGEGMRHLGTTAVDPDQWQAGARTLLGIMCPPRHWDAALDQLEALAVSRLEADTTITARLASEPIATVHSAAALVTWLYQQPGIVASPAEARSELAERASKFGRFVF